MSCPQPQVGAKRWFVLTYMMFLRDDMEDKLKHLEWVEYTWFSQYGILREASQKLFVGNVKNL